MRNQNHQKREYPTYEHERDDLKNRLNRQLRKLRAQDPAERSHGKNTKSRYYTTEMAYLLNEIQRGPVFLAPQTIRRGMELIGELEAYLNKTAEKEKGA